MLDGAHDPSSPCVDETVLAAFIDGHLPARERAVVAAHLEKCTRCSEISNGVIRTIEDVQRRARVELCLKVALAIAALVALAGLIFVALW